MRNNNIIGFTMRSECCHAHTNVRNHQVFCKKCTKLTVLIRINAKNIHQQDRETGENQLESESEPEGIVGKDGYRKM